MSANASDSSQSNSYNTRSTQSQNNAPPSSQPNLPPAQLNPPSTQSTGSSQKIWALQKGTMRIVGHGKKKPSDPYMMLQLEFNFENDPRTRKVGKASNTLNF